MFRSGYYDVDRDNIDHTLFVWMRWTGDLNQLEEAIGLFIPDSIVRVMLKEHVEWSSVARYTRSMLWAKKPEEALWNPPLPMWRNPRNSHEELPGLARDDD